MLINLEMVAREYNPAMAEYYFKNCIYNGTINECKKYLKERQEVARHNNDNEFIKLTGSMIFNGLVKYSKNSYTIAFISDSSGYIDNITNYNRVVRFIIYDNKTVAYDFPEQLPKYIKEYMDKLAKKL